MVKPRPETGKSEFTIPARISAKSRRWIEEVLEGWEPFPEDVSVAILGAEALDEIAAAQKILTAKGTTYRDRFNAPRARPENAQLRDARLVFLRCVRQLKESIAEATKQEEEPQAKRPYSNGFRRPPEWIQHLAARSARKDESDEVLE